MWQTISNFFTAATFLELFLILLSKTIEVAIGTLRTILINKGYRRVGVILSFFEVLLWVFVASRVIMGITDAPIKGVIYSLGFAIGVYAGSLLENYLAFGKVLIHVICEKKHGPSITAMVRGQGFGVTTMDAHGKDSDKCILMIFANRKGKESIVKMIQESNPQAMIVANEVSVLKGGYITPWRRIGK
ncbi:MAG: DUF5698 domain-containing protein [Acholeplasmataceae bacterium]|nr:DUF5698 domain-containing protein [Acholeplasmataceae bacterium]